MKKKSKTPSAKAFLPLDDASQIPKVIGGPRSARNVTIHMQDEDIEGMKKKAPKAGIPYQTLINSIIHRYLNGGIILKEAI